MHTVKGEKEGDIGEGKLEVVRRKTRRAEAKKRRRRKPYSLGRIEMQIRAVAGVIYEQQTCPYAIGTERTRFGARRSSRDEQIRSVRNGHNRRGILYNRAVVPKDCHGFLDQSLPSDVYRFSCSPLDRSRWESDMSGAIDSKLFHDRSIMEYHKCTMCTFTCFCR